MSVETQQQKTVLITGCSSGIGQALTKEFRKKGYFTIASARKVQDVDRIAEFASAAIQLDVELPESVSEAREKVESLLGKDRGLDILVNNAGRGFSGASIDASIKSIEQLYSVNLFGPMRVTKEFTPLLLKARGENKDAPRIVQIDSVAGSMTFPFGGIYCSSKAALAIYSYGLETEMALLGVKVVNVFAGVVGTNIFQNIQSQKDHNDTEYVDRQIVEQVDANTQKMVPKGMPADEFARSLVSKVIKPNPPAEIYEGEGSLLSWFLSLFISPRLMGLILAWQMGATPKAVKLKAN